MIDTHTHLYLPDFDTDGSTGDDAVERAVAAGVEYMIFPNVDLTTIEPMEAMAARHPGRISCAMGLHPTEVNDGWREALATVSNRLAEHRDRYVAVGEVGIDLYWDKTYEDAQMQVFDAQVAQAVALDLPIIIHCREGLEQTLEVLSAHPEARCVFHSFGGTVEDVEAIRRHGDHYFGINGIVTFKNSKLASVLPAIGLDRILLETDSPYLAPVPHRGKRNESAFLPATCAYVAQAMGLTSGEVDAGTTASACRFFGINVPSKS